MENARIEIVSTPARLHSPRLFAFAASRLKVLWGFVRSRAGSKGKTLSVCETAALGDRRFVSVIRFERQRFLIGCSAASITLLAQLPDECGSAPALEQKPVELNAEIGETKVRGEKN